MEPTSEITGQVSSIMAAHGMLPPSSAQSYLASAGWMTEGAVHLASGPSDCAIACSSLVAQALECGLKAYLSHAGVTERELKRQAVRHDLEALWEMSVAHGLGLAPVVPAWCTLLNTAHNNPYFFRYPMGLNGMVTPAPDQMIAELGHVIEVIRTSVNYGSK
jgi:hypothetical protein